MSLAPISVSLVSDRLRERVPEAFVDHSLDVQAARQLRGSLPCLFVMLGQESGSTQRGSGNSRFAQRVTTTFVVTIVVDDRGGLSGGSMANGLEALIQRTREALLNWSPLGTPAGCTVLELTGGLSAGVDDDGRAWWAERYSCDHFIEANP